jgi:hypothetical protein
MSRSRAAEGEDERLALLEEGRSRQGRSTTSSVPAPTARPPRERAERTKAQGRARRRWLMCTFGEGDVDGGDRTDVPSNPALAMPEGEPMQDRSGACHARAQRARRVASASLPPGRLVAFAPRTMTGFVGTPRW